jgi:hypothetical protein
MAKAINLEQQEKARLNSLFNQFYLRDNEEIIFDFQLGDGNLRKISLRPDDLLMLASGKNRLTLAYKIERMLARSVSALLFNRMLILILTSAILLSAELLSGI